MSRIGLNKVGRTRGQEEVQPRPGWTVFWFRGEGLTLILGALVLLSVTWVLERAGWVEELPSLSGVAIGALVLGFFLYRSRWPAGLCHGLAGLMGAGVTAVLVAWASPGSGWGQRLNGLALDLASWGQAIIQGGIRNGNIEFILLLVALFWALGYLTAWHLLRHLQAWVVVLPGGLITLVALSHLPSGYYFHFFLFLVTSVLLLVHVNLLRRQRAWGLAQVGYPPLAGMSRLSFVVAFGLIAALISWKAPPLSAAPLAGVAEKAAAPWEYLQDQFSRLFSALPAKKPFLILDWGNTLTFGAPPQLSDEILFIVESQEARYWRARAYDIYTSQGWSSSPSTQRLLFQEGPGEDVERLAMRTRVTHSVRLNVATNTLFMAGEPVRTSLPATVVTRYNELQDTFSVLSSTGLRLSQKYTVVSSVSVATPEQLRQAVLSYPSWISQYYLQLPTSLPRRVRRLAQEVTASATTPYDKALAIRDYLKATYPYNLNVKAPPSGRDGVDYFLFTKKAGYCDHYASAMVTMLRSVGVPARFVVGYATGEWDKARKVYIVRELHYHSWPEVYFPGYGWVEFEPTPPEAIELSNQPPPATTTVDAEDEDAQIPMEEEEFLEEMATPRRYYWTMVGVALLLAVLVGVAWHFWWGRLGRLGYPAEIYVKMGRLASLARLNPRPQLTPLEYAALLSGRLPALALAIKHIARVYSLTMYGPRKILSVQEGETVAQAWRRVRWGLLLYTLGRRKP